MKILGPADIEFAKMFLNCWDFWVKKWSTARKLLDDIEVILKAKMTEAVKKREVDGRNPATWCVL